MSDEKRKHLIPGIIRNDFPRKLTALILALLIYGYVFYFKLGTVKKFEGVLIIPDLPPSLVNLDDTPMRATVSVEGSEKRLDSLTPSDLKIHLKVNLAKYIPGEPYLVKLTPEMVETPLGVKVKDIAKPNRQLNLDKKDSKTVKVRIRFLAGSAPRKGYTVSETKVQPEEVTIIGPRRYIDEIDYVQTEPISLDGAKNSFEYIAKIAAKSVEASPQNVTVEVDIAKEIETRMFNSIPIKILSSKADQNLKAEITSDPNVDVSVTGLKSTLELMKAEQIKPFIDITPFDEPGVYNIQVGCWVDENTRTIQVNSIYPEKIQVKLTKK